MYKSSLLLGALYAPQTWNNCSFCPCEICVNVFSVKVKKIKFHSADFSKTNKKTR